MIIQQFILRSVSDNYFTITNKKTGAQVYASALSDMLFGDTAGKWALYKSHVDSGYLSAGYVAHRASAIVPLFDERTGEAFESGEYELKFNYQLAASGNWVSKSYTLHIDAEAPVLKNITEYKDSDGVNRVRFYFEEEKMAYATIGYNRVSVAFDEAKNMFYADETKEFVDAAINEICESGSKRLYVSGVDYARGKSAAIIHFENYDNFLEGYKLVQGPDFETYMDFKVDENNKVTFTNTIDGSAVEINNKYVRTNFAAASYEIKKKAGCGGAIASLTLIASATTLMGVSLLFLKKKKGGK